MGRSPCPGEQEIRGLFVSYRGGAQLLLLNSCYYIHLGVSMNRGQTPAAQPGASELSVMPA